MKTLTTFLLIVTLCLIGVPISTPAATVTGRSEDTSLAGTEKIPADSSGTDTYILVSKLWSAMVLQGGVTASGSSAFDFSGSTGAFKTSTGVNTFGGSSNLFAATISPSVDDAAALGTASLRWSDLFLASGGTLNFANSDVVVTHSTGILTVGTGDFRVTTAGTNTASVVTVGGTQELAAKTLTAQVVKTGLTASGSASNDFSASTGTFKTSTGLNIFGGSTHSFAGKLFPASDDGAALGDTTHHFSDLFLATGAVVNYQNGNVVITHTSGILTMGTGELRITTPGTNAASVPTLGSTSTLTSKTLTAPVLNGATSASGNFDLSGSSGTFKTTTGASTFGGSSATFASSITPATDDTGALGSASLQWSDLFLASGALIKFGSTDVVLTHSSGILTMGTGELRITTAGTNSASVPTLGSTSTLTNKTLTSPTITGPTVTGNTTTTGTLIQTSASSAAFASGLAGNTDPVFRLVNNIASQATGISITGRAAAAGVDITTLSSGTNESLVIEAKGSGTIQLNLAATGAVLVGDATNPAFTVVHTSEGTGFSVTSAAAASGAALAVISSGTNENGTINAKGSGTLLVQGTATGAFLVADATNPAFSVVHTTEGTGVKITSAAAASGVAVAAISSGTDESMTVDAKGAGNLTLQGTATGNVIANRLLYKDLVEVVTATNVIAAAESGSVFCLNSATEFVSTLPTAAAGLHFTFIVTAAPSGANYTIVCPAAATLILGHVLTVDVNSVTDPDFAVTGVNAITIVSAKAVVGDMVEVWCDGTNWFATCKCSVFDAITFD